MPVPDKDALQLARHDLAVAKAELTIFKSKLLSILNDAKDALEIEQLIICASRIGMARHLCEYVEPDQQA